MQNSAGFPGVSLETVGVQPSAEILGLSAARPLVTELQRRAERLARRGPWSISLTLLAGAGAALLLPDLSGTTAAGAALLAVGALALLAGHTWGLMVSVPSHLTLVGRIWPQLARAGEADGSIHAAGTAIILVTALPTLALAAAVLPQIAEHLVPQGTRRTHAWIVAATTIALVIALIAPSIRSQ